MMRSWRRYLGGGIAFAAAVALASTVASTSVQADHQRSWNGMVLGGGIGGAIGSQIGKGRGRLAAIGAGALLGSLYGRHVAEQHHTPRGASSPGASAASRLVWEPGLPPCVAGTAPPPASRVAAAAGLRPHRAATETGGDPAAEPGGGPAAPGGPRAGTCRCGRLRPFGLREGDAAPTWQRSYGMPRARGRMVTRLCLPRRERQLAPPSLT